jgi:putative transposase
MTQINITLEEETLKDLFMGNREKSMAILLEQVINAVLNKQATEQLNAQPYERSEDRLSYRNGFRERDITTRVGTLTLRVPKFRDGTFSTELFNSYQRSEQALILSMMEMVVQGVSTRKVGEITETLCGTSFSKSTVSALCKDLDPIVDSFRNRPLNGYYPFVLVDAIYMRARENHAVKSKGLLIATGINHEGNREVLGFTVADGESEISWSEFFENLKARGLKNVDHITSDNHGGLRNAIKKHFGTAVWQRCQTHFSKNMLDKTPKKLQPEMKQALNDMYNAPDIEKARMRKAQITEQFEKSAPKAVSLLDESFDDVTAIFNLPERYRKRLRTSNSIERLNEELRRRERVIRIFPNEDSLIRLMGAILIEQHEKWVSGKKYLDMTEFLEKSNHGSNAKKPGANPDQAA